MQICRQNGVKLKKTPPKSLKKKCVLDYDYPKNNLWLFLHALTIFEFLFDN